MKLIKIIILILIFFVLFQLFRFTILPYIDKTLINLFHNDFKSGQEYQTMAECKKNNGDWGKSGIFPKKFCRIPSNDFGKKCFSGFECQSGQCVTEMFKNDQLPIGSGSCAKYKTIFGCFKKVHFGFKDQGICLD